MVKLIEQAKKIQNARVAAGKRGYAKAVRRFLLREHAPRFDRYEHAKKSLPVAWPAKKKPDREAAEVLCG